MKRHRSRPIDTPAGPVAVVVDDEGLLEVVTNASGPHDGPHPVAEAALGQLEEYFAGRRRTFDLVLRPEGTPFRLAAWEVLSTIPYATTISYGEQAARMGRTGAARAVGGANGANPLPIVVPCHRVVGADGALTGFTGGLHIKAWLLDHERRVAGG